MPFLLLVFFMLCSSAWADTPASSPSTRPSPVGRDLVHDSMNGLRFDAFGDFFGKWHFVTVRYRKDTGEMRFVYANDIAWKAMQKGEVTDYPEGAAFGKVGVMTQEDPAFTSSVVPSGAVRYQIMLRQHGRHPETQDWTYAIFLGDHKVHGMDSDAEKAAACAACHAIVPERGYVFSKPVSLPLGGALSRMEIPAQASLGAIPSSRIAFRTVARQRVPEQVRKLMPKEAKEARLVVGPVTEHVFVGTLDEIRPTLAKEALRSHLPAALIGKDGKKFSLVFAEENSACSPPSGSSAGKPAKDLTMQAFYTADTSVPNPVPLVISRSYCERLP